MVDSKWTCDDTYISKLLSTAKVHSNVIYQVISLVSIIRKSSNYKYLNLQYLTVACYALVTSNMEIDHTCIEYLEHKIIRSRDSESSCKTLVRYCTYVLSNC